MTLLRRGLVELLHPTRSHLLAQTLTSRTKRTSEGGSEDDRASRWSATTSSDQRRGKRAGDEVRQREGSDPCALAMDGGRFWLEHRCGWSNCAAPVEVRA